MLIRILGIALAFSALTTEVNAQLFTYTINSGIGEVRGTINLPTPSLTPEAATAFTISSAADPVLMSGLSTIIDQNLIPLGIVTANAFTTTSSGSGVTSDVFAESLFLANNGAIQVNIAGNEGVVVYTPMGGAAIMTRNAAGQIILTPYPEPASVSLMAAGLIAIGAFQFVRRRRKAHADDRSCRDQLNACGGV